MIEDSVYTSIVLSGGWLLAPPGGGGEICESPVNLILVAYKMADYVPASLGECPLSTDRMPFVCKDRLNTDDLNNAPKAHHQNNRNNATKSK